MAGKCSKAIYRKCIRRGYGKETSTEETDTEDADAEETKSELKDQLGNLLNSDKETEETGKMKQYI